MYVCVCVFVCLLSWSQGLTPMGLVERFSEWRFMTECIRMSADINHDSDDPQEETETVFKTALKVAQQQIQHLEVCVVRTESVHVHDASTGCMAVLRPV